MHDIVNQDGKDNMCLQQLIQGVNNYVQFVGEVLVGFYQYSDDVIRPDDVVRALQRKENGMQMMMRDLNGDEYLVPFLHGETIVLGHMYPNMLKVHEVQYGEQVGVVKWKDLMMIGWNTVLLG